MRRLLRERDEQLYETRSENTELREQLKKVTEENTVLHNRCVRDVSMCLSIRTFSERLEEFYTSALCYRNHILDAAVTDLLAAIHLDEGQTSVKEAVEEVTSRLRQQENLIRTLHEQLADKVRVESDLRNATSVMTDQIEDLKRELAEHDDVRAEERKNLEQEVTRLKERLQQETTSAFSWRKRYLLTQAQWTERSGELEAVVRHGLA